MNAWFEALVDALSAPGVLPGGGSGPAERHDTHVSVVLLSGERAFKLKKPVDLGFLDFTDRRHRREMAREELRLNRRFAPDVYLGLASASLDAGRLRVGPVGDEPAEPGEWLVVMRRLPASGMLDVMIREGRATEREMRAVAGVVARIHRDADRGPVVARHGTPEAVGALVRGNIDEVGRVLGASSGASHLARIDRRVRGWLAARGTLLRARHDGGFIRDLHGDLHAGNVCLPPDREPILYDGLEFAPALRCADVASEVAFLDADCEARGAAELGREFVDAYEDETDDGAFRQLLPFYGCHRALVRGKVETLRGDPEELSASFLEVAVRRAAGLVPPLLVVVCGLSGSGKTTLADTLARRAGLDPLDTDRTRKEHAGLDPDRPAPAPPGRGLYSAAASEATYDALLADAAARLARGHAVVVSGCFLRVAERERARAAARSTGAEFLLVELDAPREVLLGRIEARPVGPSDADAAVLDWQIARQETLDREAAGRRLTLDAARLAPDALADRVLERAGALLDRGEAA